MMNLDPVLLRSFLAVAETLSFTAAARREGCNQSTVSQHVQRLEAAIGRPLLRRNTRLVELTADGGAMIVFARDILAAQDRALNYFTSGALRGTLRLGVTEDLSLTRLPEILRRFRASNPGVELQLVVGLSSPLANRLNAGELDLLFAKRLDPAAPGIPVWSERLVWLASPGISLERDAPVPLVCFPGGSITRRVAIAALEKQQRSWRQSVVGESLSALLAALRAGFGISAQVSFLARNGLAVVAGEADLPGLPMVDFVLLERPGVRMIEPAATLVRTILDGREDILRWTQDHALGG